MGLSWIALSALAASVGSALQLNVESADSIKAASSTIVYDMLTVYTGNQTGNVPGNLPPPYYWWECGGMFMHMVDYYYYTGDASNNPATVQAISWQATPDGEFMSPNQTTDEGNDDQVFWAFAAMEAAEHKFPPPTSGFPSYTAMGEAVLQTQIDRWDPENCGGGLRWQILPTSGTGYTYKNMATNGGFFQLAARLARYTGNETYTHWAEKMWDWIDQSHLLDKDTPQGTRVYDGAGIQTNCTTPQKTQYTYNYGILIGGLAYMYNHTEDVKYTEALWPILNATFAIFFPNGDKIMVEVACEPEDACQNDADRPTFKSFLARWLIVCAQLVPDTASVIWPYIEASAQGAAGQCDGPDDDECGYHWDTTTWDGTSGVGQQMSALAVVAGNMANIESLPPPLTLKTGGTSKSDPNAGTETPNDGDPTDPWLTKKITTGDKAGAGVLTAMLLLSTLGGSWWLLSH